MYRLRIEKDGQLVSRKTTSARTVANKRPVASKTAKTAPTPKAAATVKRARAGKRVTIKRDDYLMTARIRSKAKGDTIVTPNQIATMLGTSGKRVRGALRDADVCGNDGQYTRWGFDSTNQALMSQVLELVCAKLSLPIPSTAAFNKRVRASK
jgi:hypothetical protein